MVATQTALETTDHDAPPPSARRWWLLIAMCTAQLMVILDATIVNIALPAAQRGLGFSAADRQWVVTAYALAFGSLLLIGGRVADRIGRRTAILVGLAGFGAASALGGAAVDFPMLVAARAVQGVFGALLTPATLAVVTTTFTEQRERARAFGIYGAVSAGGGAVGLLLGGILTEYSSWRWTLYVNTVLAVLGILAALATLGRQPRTEPARPDIAGTICVTMGLLAVVYGFSNADQHGWTAPVTLACLGAGLTLIAVFVLVEARVPNPMLPLRVLAARVRAASLTVLFLGSVSLFAEVLFLTYYLQDNLHFSPIQAGLAFVPQTLGAVVAASVGSGVLLHRFLGSVLVPLGMLMAAGGAYLLGGIDSHDHYAAVVLPGTTLIGAGVGLAFSIAVNLAIQGVEDADAGVASATVNAVQQVGGSIGPALFNTIAGSVLASYVASHAAHARGVADDAATATRMQAAAAIHSYSVAFYIAAAILFGAALINTVLLGIRVRPATDDLVTEEALT